MTATAHTGVDDLIVCESAVAITTHLRTTTDVTPNYGGHWPRPLALCGSEIAWDTKLPLGAARCLACIKQQRLREVAV